jgi:hypothetical protein
MAATKTTKTPVVSLLRDEARRVFGKDFYLMTTRTAPWKVMVGNKSYEVSVFNLDDDGTVEAVYEQTLACLTALPDQGKKQKTCSFCQKPGHVRKHCPELEAFTG